MNSKNCLSLVKVWQFYMYLTVKTTSTKQCLVQHIHSVRGSKNNNSRVRTKAIHFGKEGIESILALIVSTHSRMVAPCSTNSINLVYEDNARSFRLCLGEEVTNSRGSHSNKHFNKV